MLESISNVPIPASNLEQSIINVIESIAKSEEAVANILNSESEILQKMKNTTGDIGGLVSLNESVNHIMKNVVKLQMLMESKLEGVEAFLKSMGDFDEFEDYDELEE